MRRKGSVRTYLVLVLVSGEWRPSPVRFSRWQSSTTVTLGQQQLEHKKPRATSTAALQYIAIHNIYNTTTSTSATLNFSTSGTRTLTQSRALHSVACFWNGSDTAIQAGTRFVGAGTFGEGTHFDSARYLSRTPISFVLHIYVEVQSQPCCTPACASPIKELTSL